MTTQPESGELLVGAYLKLVEDCELVMYNQRSKAVGEQMEIDVIGVARTSSGEQTVYTCEVVTHLNGLQYSGTPTSDKWADHGGDAYQYTLERIWQKFTSDENYVRNLFDAADTFVFQLWSPVVPEGILKDGLSVLATEFERETGTELELIINGQYTDKVEALREAASSTTKNYDELGIRLFQILGHLR